MTPRKTPSSASSPRWFPMNRRLSYDFVGNGFDVGTLSNVHAYCWDSFSEEVAGGMGVINTFSSDFPYQECTKPMLLSGFGMTEGGIPKTKELV